LDAPLALERFEHAIHRRKIGLKVHGQPAGRLRTMFPKHLENGC
jgi:hypothetical protein